MSNSNYTKQIISDYVVLDTETTGLSIYYDEIIEIGLVKVRNDDIVETYSQLIKPKSPINSFITKLTGITNEMVEGMPSIADVKNQVLEFIGDDIIVGHKTSFDLAFLRSGFDVALNNKYMDTLQFSLKLFPEFKDHKLITMVRELGLQNNEHRALADCISTKGLYDSIKATMLDKNLKIESLWRKTKIKDFVATTTKFDEEGPFYQRHVVFTGTLKKMPRSKAQQLVVDVGGILDNNITKHTNFLVLGSTDYNPNLKGKKSSKHLKAEKYILKGQDLVIIDEFTFYDLLDS